MASPDPIKLTPTSHLVLGMVRLGVGSGYAIKKAADGSTQNFWPISLALVYPELARLEAGGLLKRRNDAQGGRARSAYTITAKGEKALVAWLRSPKVAPVQIRDEAMLKLFLADALEEPEQRELIAGLRERNRERRIALEAEAIPHAEALGAHGIHYVAVAARLSADLLRYAEGWLGRLERKIQER
jgi:PadR family transcriptional regulator, regulatory protein AphA